MRMTTSQFNVLSAYLAPRLHTQDTRFRPGIRGEERIVLGISVLTCSNRFATGSNLWERGKSTYHESFHRFINAVVEVLVPRLIRFPTGNTAQRSAAEFLEMCGLPNCVGVVDGSHFPVNRPKDQHLFYNRKKCHTLNTMLTVDAFRRIVDASVGHPGSMHDARIFRRSNLV